MILFTNFVSKVKNWYRQTPLSLKFAQLVTLLIVFLTIGYALFIIRDSQITFTPIASIQNKIDERFVEAVRKTLNADPDLQQFKNEINSIIAEYDSAVSDVADPGYGAEQCWSVNGTQKSISIHTTDFEKLEKLQKEIESLQQKRESINDLLVAKMKDEHTLLSRFASERMRSFGSFIINSYHNTQQLNELEFEFNDPIGAFGKQILPDGKCSLTDSVFYTETDLVNYFKLTPLQDEFIKVDVTREFPIESACNQDDSFVRNYLDEHNYDRVTPDANGVFRGGRSEATCYMYYSLDKSSALVYFSTHESKEGSEGFGYFDYYFYKNKEKSYTKLENFPPYEINYLKLPSFKINNNIVYLDMNREEVKNVFFTYDFDMQSRKYIDFETEVILGGSDMWPNRYIFPSNFQNFTESSFDGRLGFDCQEPFGLFTLPTDPGAYYIQLFRLPYFESRVSPGECDKSEQKFLMRFKLNL